MWHRIAADIVLVAHLAFILFIIFGGLFVLRWPWVAWAHVPSWMYGALIEFIGWTCPLTPLEQRLRLRAGEGGYEGSFIEHYLVPIIYPAGYSFELRMVLGTAVVVLNIGVYAWVIWRRNRDSVEGK
jgi:hypothetical protein